MCTAIEIRTIDKSRAAQMVMAQIVGDEAMFALAVNDTFDDDYQLGELELGSVINVLRSMSEDLAGVLIDAQGREDAESLLRTMMARLNAEVTS